MEAKKRKPTNGFGNRPEDIYRGGRKKKIFTVLKEKGYNKSDIVSAIRTLAFYTEKELGMVIKGTRQPMIARIIAQQFQQSYDKKDWTKIKDLVEQIIGRPSQSVEQTVNVKEQPLLPSKYNQKK